MIKIDEKNPIGNPNQVPSHEIHDSLFSSSISFLSDGWISSGHVTLICIPHNPLLFAKYFKSFILLICPPRGIFPVNLLSLTSRIASWYRFASDWGILPESLLCDKSKLSMLFRLPKDTGICPKMLLCEMLSSFRPSRLPNDAGISPDILFSDKSKKEYISSLRLDRP